MPLKSTNIWDDVRGEDEEEDSSNSSVSSCRSSVRRGSSSTEDPNESDVSVKGSHHANRHGVSMKSLMKNR